MSCDHSQRNFNYRRRACMVKFFASLHHKALFDTWYSCQSRIPTLSYSRVSKPRGRRPQRMTFQFQASGPLKKASMYVHAPCLCMCCSNLRFGKQNSRVVVQKWGINPFCFWILLNSSQLKHYNCICRVLCALTIQHKEIVLSQKLCLLFER